MARLLPETREVNVFLKAVQYATGRKKLAIKKLWLDFVNETQKNHFLKSGTVRDST